MNKNNFAVIMAGGVGSRFWPMSTEEKPKQFLDVLGRGKTLIQMTYDRLIKLVPANQIFVVTNQKYAALVKAQIGLADSNILTEPMRKNTAPAIAYAAHKIFAINSNANLIVAPSDHLILKEADFVSIVTTALYQAEQNDCLVTLGLKPTRPDTGYGYIQFENDNNSKIGEVKKVIQFTEKPNLEKAEKFISSGDYFWNSGIFIWRAKTIIDSLQAFKPKLNELFTAKNNEYNSSNEQTFVNNAFTNCEDVSIDFAVLEPATNVFVVLADLGWSDLGTWGSLNTHLSKDENNNAVIGDGVHLFDSKNCIINIENGKTVLLQGLDDYIVVESSGILMVVKKENEQEIKNYVARMKGKK